MAWTLIASTPLATYGHLSPPLAWKRVAWTLVAWTPMATYGLDTYGFDTHGLDALAWTLMAWTPIATFCHLYPPMAFPLMAWPLVAWTPIAPHGLDTYGFYPPWLVPLAWGSG